MSVRLSLTEKAVTLPNLSTGCSLAGSHRGDFFLVYIHSICPQRQGASGHRFVYLGHQEDGLCHWLLYGSISGHEEASLVKSLGIRERVKSFLLASLAIQSILAPKKQAAVLQRFPRQTQVLGAEACGDKSKL